MGYKRTGGWKRLEKALDPKTFSKALRDNIQKANKINGYLIQAGIRQNLRSASSKYVKNAALTVSIKDSTKPLTDRGDLFGAIAVVETEWNTVFIGVLQTDKNYNVAIAIHDGRNIIVTEKMRRLFYVLWRASVGSIDPASLDGRAKELWDRKPGDWHQLRESTVALRVPPRPFAKDAFEDRTLRAKVVENWEKAVNAAIRQASDTE